MTITFLSAEEGVLPPPGDRNTSSNIEGPEKRTQRRMNLNPMDHWRNRDMSERSRRRRKLLLIAFVIACVVTFICLLGTSLKKVSSVELGVKVMLIDDDPQTVVCLHDLTFTHALFGDSMIDTRSNSTTQLVRSILSKSMIPLSLFGLTSLLLDIPSRKRRPFSRTAGLPLYQVPLNLHNRGFE